MSEDTPKDSIAYELAHTCIRYLYERSYDGKYNPACIGCMALENNLPCPLGPAAPDKDPFAAIRITKEEYISLLEKKREVWNREVDKRIEEIKNG